MRKSLLSLASAVAILALGAQSASAGYQVDTLLFTGFNTDVTAAGDSVQWATGDIIAAGTANTESVQGAGWIVSGGPNGQRMNNQASAWSESIGSNYGPATEADAGTTSSSMSWLKSKNGGYLISPEPVAGPFEISTWLCTAKDKKYTELMEVAVSTDKTEWTVIETLEVTSCKAFTRFDISYEGTEPVYLKFTSRSANGSNNNMLMNTLLVHRTVFVADDIKVAYIYDASYSNYCGIDNDPIFQQSLQNYQATAIDVAGKTVADIPLDSLENTYDVVVLGEGIKSSHAYAGAMVGLVNRVPMLNLKSYMYKSGVWSWGGGANPDPKQNCVTVHPDFYESPLFENIGTDLAESEGVLQLFANDVADKNNVQGYTVSEGSPIANDPVIATVASYNAIHMHGEKNTYMLIPLSADDMVRDGEVNLTEDAFIIINNAVTMLAMSKADVNPAQAPKFEKIYTDGLTRVVITTPTDETNIYYTIDGTEPTLASTQYTDTLSFTTGVMLKAIAGGRAYSESPVTADTVVVKTKLPVPSYKVLDIEGSAAKTVVFEAPIEETQVWANFVGSAETTYSQVVDTIIVAQSSVVTCFAYDENHLASDPVTFAVDIDVKAMNDTIVHLDFKTWNTSDLISDKYYDYYKTVEEADTTYKVPADSLITRVDQEGWEVGSYGQRLLVQSTGTSSLINTDYGPADIFSTGATGYALSFLQCKNGGDPTSAYLRSTTTYAGPFDVVVYLTGQQSSSTYECVEVLTSTDGETWTLVDSIGSYNYKRMYRGVAHYAGTEPVYVKFKAASIASDNTKTKAMLFDVLLLKEGTVVGIESAVSEVAKTVVGVKMYNISGQRVQNAVKGLNVVVTEFSDGSIHTQKVFIK